MNKEELVGRVAAALREKEIRKPIRAQKSVFHISDDDGNGKDFVITSPQKTVMFNIDDVRNIVDTLLQVVEESLCRGESINIRGFGALELRYREKRQTKRPGTDEWVDIEGRYVPKFTFGNTLRMAARVYQMSLGDVNLDIPLPVFDDEPEDEDDAD